MAQQNVDDSSNEGDSQIDQDMINSNISNPNASTAKQTPPQALLTKKRASAPKKRQDEFETKVLKILEKPDSIPTISEDKSFFNSILPIVENFDEDDKLQFRIEVLQLVQRFKRKQKCDAFNMTSDTNRSLPSFVPPATQSCSQQWTPTYHTLQCPQTSIPQSSTSFDPTTSRYDNNLEYPQSSIPQ
ncbi:unnamed protein product [Acanthoscelides obtectus]|nr:unnamed protein product [Acanthoscelides obtectus]CAH2006442.1 unnamed protein product [Acanthoscelides obtectus]CAK1660270.1 hypothetical protein AOBTE_LOCUS21951 [Acanthoscelides obtectus]CAK1688432.1 hypothetical protein AOBTE_LOCUS36717 [Acanthoscelides obtectus]